MENKNPLQQLRCLREQSRSLKRKGLPADQPSAHQKRKHDKEHIGVILLVAALGGIASGCLIAMFYPSFAQHKMISLIIGTVAGASGGVLAYSAWPAILWLCRTVGSSHPPEPDFFKQFRIGHLPLCGLSFPTIITIVSAYLISFVGFFGRLPTLPSLPVMHAETHPMPFDQAFGWVFQLPALGVYENWLSEMIGNLWPLWVGWMIITLAFFIHWQWSNRAAYRATVALGSHDEENNDEFRLWLGASTGRLAQLGHSANLAPKQQVSLTLEDATQNILILGGIGSGKTTRAMHPLLIQLLQQQCGGLIFDVKGDFHHAVHQFAQQTGQSILTIGPGHTPLNLLAGLTPEIAASFLKSALLLAGQHRSDPFWIDSAAELCRNSLGLLSFVPSHYSLKGLYRYLFNAPFRGEITEALEARRAHLTEDELGRLEAFEEYQTHLYDNFDEKIKAGIHATLAQVLSPFNQPALTKAFCTATPESQDLAAVLTGSVFLVSLPLATWGLGAKVVYTLLKLRFYNLMQQRTSQTPSPALRPVFFLCDEFQELVSANKDGLSDLNFWDKSRSSKTIGIVSAQALSSFYAALGSHDLANALCQNFRQKLCFRTEDPTTLQYFQSLVDKVEVLRRTSGRTSGTQSASGNGSAQTSHSQSENAHWTEKPVLTAQLFRQLLPDQGVALLSIGGQSADDILDMMPVYVSPSTLSKTEALTSAGGCLKKCA